MTSPLSRYLGEVRERLGKATPGEWEFSYAHWGRAQVIRMRPDIPQGDADQLMNGIPFEYVTDYIEPANAALIAHAPTDLARLLAIVEKLTATAERLAGDCLDHDPPACRCYAHQLRECIQACEGMEGGK